MALHAVKQFCYHCAALVAVLRGLLTTSLYPRRKMPSPFQSVITFPTQFFPVCPAKAEFSPEDASKISPLPFSTPSLQDEGSDSDSEGEEEMLVSLKEDVERDSVEFYEVTYEAIFARLRAAVMCLEDEELTFAHKKRHATKAQAFCEAVLTSRKRVQSQITKHSNEFLDFLILTSLDCESECCSELLSTWFSLIFKHVPGSRRRTLDKAILLLSEMIVGERSDQGLENLLFHFYQFLELCFEDINSIEYFTQIITRVLLPLYRLKCFYLSPKYKTRQCRLDRRPIMLRIRLHKIFAFCLLKYPDLSDAITNGLIRQWDCCRHLRVNPVKEEVEFVIAELKTMDVISQYDTEKITDIYFKLSMSHQRGLLTRLKRQRDQWKRLYSLKQSLFLKLSKS